MSRPKNYNKPGIFAVKFVAVILEIARGRPADSIARPTSLSRIHTVTMEGSTPTEYLESLQSEPKPP